ncbi:50S ribosomal protein L44e [Candidatus Micrarchaeota archaeon]|nr:50S ribosomal protein L44e [Candidatus Micrarchaeota archaeon]
MKFPKETNTYCPYCRKHTVHKVKIPSKGRARKMSIGNRKHEKSLKGHGGKRAGEKTVKKQGKRQRVMLICPECNKKHERTISGRTKKKLEIQR